MDTTLSPWVAEALGPIRSRLIANVTSSTRTFLDGVRADFLSGKDTTFKTEAELAAYERGVMDATEMFSAVMAAAL